MLILALGGLSVGQGGCTVIFFGGGDTEEILPDSLPGTVCIERVVLLRMLSCTEHQLSVFIPKHTCTLS